MGKLFDCAIYGMLTGIALYAVAESIQLIVDFYKLTH